MNTVSAVIVLALAVVGAAAVLRGLAVRLFCHRDDATVMLITRIRSGTENPELVLRSALARRRWSMGKRITGTVCIDAPLNEKTRKICESVCREYGVDALMTKEEFIKSLD